MLKGKNIILGITGSIAAYKAAILVRLLVKEGAEVQVLITPAGKEFITPLTLSALSGRPVYSEFFVNTDGSWNSHVDLGLWADLMIIAPCSATTLGKMAGGIADNMLITTYLSAKCPIFIAPAMDLDMYKHPSTQRNIDTLRSYGNKIIEPQEGELASGLTGVGRLAEPEHIISELQDFFFSTQNLKGKRFLITAGPTHEAIDPVRYIGNHSTGKMGYTIANELASRGGEVIIISGPGTNESFDPSIKRVVVQSADEMYTASIEHFKNIDCAVMTAAVADYTPVNVDDKKIKREKEIRTIELKPTKDIAASLGEIKRKDQFVVGFALETNDEEENARKKIKNKKLDFIVLNSLNDEGAGFGYNTNKITIIDKNNNSWKFKLKSKADAAKDIVNKISEFFD